MEPLGNNKKVLLLSYHFPPESSGGIGRPFSLYKYLPENGYDVSVVTVSEYGKISDEKDVYRFESLLGWRRNGIFTPKLFYRLINGFFKFFGFDKSYDVYWHNNVKSALDGIIANNDICCVYVTYPSLQSLLLGLYAKRKYNLPLVSEIRDGICFEPLHKPSLTQSIVMKIIERNIAKLSDCIITIGESLTDYFARTYNISNAHTVHNGYDSEDFREVSVGRVARVKDDITRFIHFGNVGNSKKRSITPLYEAISSLKVSGLASSKNFEMVFIGNLTPDEMQLLTKYNISDLVSIEPYMSKKSGFSKISEEADYLLFYGVEGESTFISSKLLEYLKLDKPILGICKGNDAEKIIKMTGTGEVCDFTPDSIFAMFSRFLNNEMVYRPDATAIRKFDRHYQAGRIAEILNATLAQTRQ